MNQFNIFNTIMIVINSLKDLLFLKFKQIVLILNVKKSQINFKKINIHLIFQKKGSIYIYFNLIYDKNTLKEVKSNKE